MKKSGSHDDLSVKEEYLCPLDLYVHVPRCSSISGGTYRMLREPRKPFLFYIGEELQRRHIFTKKKNEVASRPKSRVSEF